MSKDKRIDEKRSIDVNRFQKIDIERNNVTTQRTRNEDKVRDIEREKQDRKKSGG